ncbi:MAG: caspase family protein [Sphaerochaetaceae bacterium]
MKKFIILLIGLPLMLLTLLSCELMLPSPKNLKMHAVFIALDYTNHANGLNRLAGTIRDAKEVMAAFEELYDNPKQDIATYGMFQEGANPQAHVSEELYPTIENITMLLTQIVKDLGPNELLFVYYAGHGTSGSSLGDLAVAGDNPDEIAIFSREDFLEALSGPTNGHIVVVLDSCYSGSYVQNYPQGLETLSYRPHITMISASSPTKESYEKVFFGNGHNHGVFTYLLLKALGWDHQDGIGEKYEGDVLVEVAGKIRKNTGILSDSGGLISVGGIYRYIKNRLRGQKPMTVNGPLDIALFVPMR